MEIDGVDISVEDINKILRRMVKVSSSMNKKLDKTLHVCSEYMNNTIITASNMEPYTKIMGVTAHLASLHHSIRTQSSQYAILREYINRCVNTISSLRELVILQRQQIQDVTYPVSRDKKTHVTVCTNTESFLQEKGTQATNLKGYQVTALIYAF
jgi:hypothetical protein